MDEWNLYRGYTGILKRFCEIATDFFLRTES